MWIPHEERIAISEQFGICKIHFGKVPRTADQLPNSHRLVGHGPIREKRVGRAKSREKCPYSYLSPISNLKLQWKEECFIPISRCWLSCVGWPSCIRIFPGSEYGLNLALPSPPWARSVACPRGQSLEAQPSQCDLPARSSAPPRIGGGGGNGIGGGSDGIGGGADGIGGGGNGIGGGDGVGIGGNFFEGK